MCPECGLDYDGRGVVVMLPGLRSEYRQVAYALMLLAMFAIAAVRRGWEGSMVNFPALVGLLAIRPILTIAGQMQRFRMLVVSRRFIRFFDRHWRELKIEWSPDGRARRGWITGRLILKTSACHQKYRVSESALGGSEGAKLCVREINRLSPMLD